MSTMLRAKNESNWHRLPLLTALSALAALLHDLGKVAQAFQDPARSSATTTLGEDLLDVQAHACLVARSLPTLTRNLPALRKHKGLYGCLPDGKKQFALCCEEVGCILISGLGCVLGLVSQAWPLALMRIRW